MRAARLLFPCGPRPQGRRSRSPRPTRAQRARGRFRSPSRPTSAGVKRSRSRSRKGAAMPEYPSPGVYVEEIDAWPKPIAGVSTSTAGAVGVSARGPTTGKPELVTSFADYVRKFGSFLDPPNTALVNRWELDAVEGARWWWFPLSVKGFFDNGGERL